MKLPWMSMDSAPRTGEAVLLYAPLYGIVEGHYRDGCWKLMEMWRVGDEEMCLRAWCPLPDYPTISDTPVQLELF